MRLLQIINKLWSKITETKWAILYVRFAAVRLVVAIAMNAVILKLHEDIAEKLLNLHDIENDLPDDRKYAYINYDYEIYRRINLARSLKWIGRINNQLEIDRPFIDDDTVDTTDISRAVITWEIIHLLILTGFAASSLFFGYKLYQHFGWNIYKKIGANIQMQAMYRTYLGNTRTIILQCIMVAIVIPTIGLALWGVSNQ
ncbi:5124_t:CDS:2 [Entrophospora sp. SA101]|nr:5124_t:CDS:2 [Entrophospora sp. SA101]